MQKTPSYKARSFKCPYCEVVAQQRWADCFSANWDGGFISTIQHGLQFSQCQNCKESAVWKDEKLVFPEPISLPLPNVDMTELCVKYYNEARQVFGASPRASAALLRLVVQCLCKELGEGGVNINNDIASLVKKGLPPQIQKALDWCRVVGNNAVHPGTLDVDDNPEIALKLFDLVNFIVREMIERPKELEALYAGLPQGALAAIEKRDSK